jgi:hypothetical protein
MGQNEGSQPTKTMAQNHFQYSYFQYRRILRNHGFILTADGWILSTYDLNARQETA